VKGVVRDGLRPIGLFVLAGIFVVSLVGTNWTGPRPIADFAELFTAYFLNAAVILVALALGVYVGERIAKGSHSNALGWILGITTLLAIGYGGSELVSHIPGVGWRIYSLS
jgi:hypothetical protein